MYEEKLRASILSLFDFLVFVMDFPNNGLILTIFLSVIDAFVEQITMTINTDTEKCLG